jgi:hypothetical protein
MGRAPGGPAGVAAIVSESERFEVNLGVLQIAAGIGTGPSAVASGCIVHVGDIAHAESTRARPPGPWPGVPAVGLDAVTGLLGNVCGGTTQPSSPCCVTYRESQEPQGPASSITIRGGAVDGLSRMS